MNIILLSNFTFDYLFFTSIKNVVHNYLQNGFIDRVKSKVSDVKVHFTHSGFCIKEIVVASQVSFFANYDFDFWVFHVYIDCRKYRFHTTSLL